MSSALFGNTLPSFDPAVFSIYAVDSHSGQVLLDERSDTSFIPASCMKIITTATALFLLKPNTRFQTHLEYDGIINEKGTLEGNLYIRGGGDPCLGSNRVAPSLDWNEQVAVWAQAISELGIKRIEGTIIGDATLWEKALAVPSWSYEDTGNYYGAGASALTFHENSYSLVFKPGKTEGEQTDILRFDPPLSQLKLLNEVETGPEGSGDRACIYGSEFSYIQCVRGTVPKGVKEFTIRGAMPNPAESCAAFLKEALMDKEITISEKVINSERDRTSFHTTYSPPIKDIVFWTNKKSINLYAEHLLKEMGNGSTTAGTKIVTDFWHRKGVDLSGFYMEDGSGLSRKNCLTTKQLVEILLKVKESELFPMFLESLPEVYGCKVKSGSMSLIKGYAGFKGKIVFAVLVNQALDPKTEKKLELLLTDLSEQAFQPSP